MFVTGRSPSPGVAWLALLRQPGTIAPCWARPCSASPPLPVPAVLTACRFHVDSVKPRLYDQSCIRLCIANRLAVAASMSLRCSEAKVPGSHFCEFHWLVHG